MKPDEIIARIEHAPDYSEAEVEEAIVALVGCEGCRGSGIQQMYRCPECGGTGIDLEMLQRNEALMARSDHFPSEGQG